MKITLQFFPDEHCVHVGGERIYGWKEIKIECDNNNFSMYSKKAAGLPYKRINNPLDVAIFDKYGFEYDWLSIITI